MVDVGLGVSGRDERGFELAAREVDAPGEHLPEEPAEKARVRQLGVLVIVDGLGGEEEGEHAPDALDDVGDAGVAGGAVEAVGEELYQDGFVLRYDPHADGGVDGLPGDEGAFLACSFWLVDAYAMTGRVPEAHALFERLLALRNDVGLLAEEYDTRTERQVGNFPQAFSHLALVNSAHSLAMAERPCHQRRAEPERAEGVAA